MNGRLGHLGDTWTVRYGSRAGIQVRGRDGTLRRPAYRGWSSEAYEPPARTSLYSPTPASQPYGLNLAAPDLGRSGKVYQKMDVFAVEKRWKEKGYSLAKPEKDPVWGALVARAAFQMASGEAPSMRGKFGMLASEAPARFSGVPVERTLQTVKGEIGNAAPKARAWLTARAKSWAVAFEGWQDPEVARREATTKAPATPPTTQAGNTGSSIDWMELAKKWGPWVVGGTAVVVLGKMLFFPRRKEAVRVVGP